MTHPADPAGPGAVPSGLHAPARMDEAARCSGRCDSSLTW